MKELQAAALEEGGRREKRGRPAKEAPGKAKVEKRRRDEEEKKYLMHSQ